MTADPPVSKPLPAAGVSGTAALVAFAAALAASAFLFRIYHMVPSDVAFFTWTAQQVLGGAVYGRDILDPNPPLSVLIYVPAVLLAKITGLEWGIRIWFFLISVLSVAALWQTAGSSLRLAVCAALVAFVVLAYPDGFAQREQISLLLCAPYVAGPARSRGWAVTNGIMAGVGFLMKPHFLIPLVLLVALRRRIATEEKAIGCMGVLYALLLVLFFRPYMFEMVPAGVATYWAISFSWQEIAAQAALVFLALPLALAAAPQPAARPYLVAALGFALAGVLQMKGFYYHFIPAFGFLTQFLAVTLFNAKRLAAVMAAMLLLINGVYLGQMAMAWVAASDWFMAQERDIEAAVGKSSSFMSLGTQPFPAFPAAIRTTARYEGLASTQIFMPAAKKLDSGEAEGDRAGAVRLARDQALRELSRQPDLVIVSPYAHDASGFDMLTWFNQDEAFRTLWQAYSPDGEVGPYKLYRRK